MADKQNIWSYILDQIKEWWQTVGGIGGFITLITPFWNKYRNKKIDKETIKEVVEDVVTLTQKEKNKKRRKKITKDKS